MLSADDSAFYTKKIERTTTTGETGLVDAQIMTASTGNSLDNIFNGVLSVYTDTDLDNYLTACLTYLTSGMTVSDIFWRPLLEGDDSSVRIKLALSE